ncbi:hypothetical protein PIB30_102244 [Stylosanthes scabra]|uniref:Uncharacterized protein n=1 Tax=Stylosanthes scabra TaxID=79078 RepID=A0ABU6WZB1_9FABA|nr:hypothetical protein [Stylosanthes scabra]
MEATYLRRRRRWTRRWQKWHIAPPGGGANGDGEMWVPVFLLLVASSFTLPAPFSSGWVVEDGGGRCWGRRLGLGRVWVFKERETHGFVNERGSSSRRFILSLPSDQADGNKRPRIKQGKKLPPSTSSHPPSPRRATIAPSISSGRPSLHAPLTVNDLVRMMNRENEDVSEALGDEDGRKQGA